MAPLALQEVGSGVTCPCYSIKESSTLFPWYRPQVAGGSPLPLPPHSVSPGAGLAAELWRPHGAATNSTQLSPIISHYHLIRALPGQLGAIWRFTLSVQSFRLWAGKERTTGMWLMGQGDRDLCGGKPPQAVLNSPQEPSSFTPQTFTLTFSGDKYFHKHSLFSLLPKTDNPWELRWQWASGKWKIHQKTEKPWKRNNKQHATEFESQEIALLHAIVTTRSYLADMMEWKDRPLRSLASC